MSSHRKVLDVFLPLRASPTAHHVRKKVFKKKVIESLRVVEKGIGKNQPLEQRVSLTVVFHFLGLYRGDVDNLLKNLLDALEDFGIVENDTQVRHITASIVENSLIEGISIKMARL